jgi:acyl dehydratase
VSNSNIENPDSGEYIPSFTTLPISRLTLALFAGASGDHHPIHVDIDYARQAGINDVFGHGMLAMAYLGRLLTNWADQRRLRRFNARFVAIVQVHERLTCTGRVVEELEEDGEKLVRLVLTVANEKGEVKVTGDAIITTAMD